jgi:predicted molibdopterin-dependent oxidoreductase YjgC
MIHGRKADRDEALDFVATEFKRIRDKHGPEAIAFSGQFLIEDYCVANKLMKGLIEPPDKIAQSRSIPGFSNFLQHDAT